MLPDLSTSWSSTLRRPRGAETRAVGVSLGAFGHPEIRQQFGQFRLSSWPRLQRVDVDLQWNGIQLIAAGDGRARVVLAPPAAAAADAVHQEEALAAHLAGPLVLAVDLEELSGKGLRAGEAAGEAAVGQRLH